MKRLTSLLALAASTLALTGIARAQQPTTPATPPAAAPGTPEGVQVFEPAFFARYNPVTAEDLVRQLPGFTLDEGAELRGFGATAGNVLIDGQRPSSKTSIRDELGRIAAGSVARVELIRASAAGDLDVRGYTELANVVLKPAIGMKESTTFAATLRGYEQGRVGAQLAGTHTWKTDNFSFRLGVQATSLGEREEVDATFRNALGVVTRTQTEFYQNQVDDLVITGAANWTPSPRDTWNANFRVLPRLFTTNAAAEVNVPALGGPAGGIALDYTEKDIWYVDLGGDYEHKFDGQNAVKLITVNRLVNWRPQQVLTQNLVAGLGGQAQQIDNFNNRAGEHVLRGVWTTKPDTQHTVELGLEGAYNYRSVDRESRAGAIGGPFTPVVVPVASTKVEEDRIEASINDVWRLNPQITLEAGFNYETSTITQSGDASNERDFTYSKPRAVATWTPSADDQFRLSFLREVSQLDFGDFATGPNSISNSANIGNPQLVPEQTWKASVQWKRALGPRGSISFTGFYDDIEDTQDFITVPPPVGFVCRTPAGLPGQCSAVGNIGDGTRWGGRIEATLPLDAVGVAAGILKLNVGAQDSEVTDPRTGETRQISSEQEFDWAAEFRQDVPAMKFAWGGKVNSIGPTPNYRADRLETTEPKDPNIDLFVETTAFLGGLLVRVTGANLLDVEKETERRYVTTTFFGDEFRSSTMGRSLTLTVAGAF